MFDKATYINNSAELKTYVTESVQGYLIQMTEDEIREVVDAIHDMENRPAYGDDWSEFLAGLEDFGTYSPSYMAAE